MTVETVSRSIVVNADAFRTYDRWIEFNWFEQGGMGKANIVEVGDEETKIGCARKLAGVATETIVTAEKGKKIEYKVTAPGVTKYLATVTFEENEDGKTEVTWTSEIETNFLFAKVFSAGFGSVLNKQLSALDKDIKGQDVENLDI